MILGRPCWMYCHEYDGDMQRWVYAQVSHVEDFNVLEVIRYGPYSSYYVYRVTEIIRSTRELIHVRVEPIDCIDYRDDTWGGYAYPEYLEIFESIFGCKPPGKSMRELRIEE